MGVIYELYTMQCRKDIDIECTDNIGLSVGDFTTYDIRSLLDNPEKEDANGLIPLSECQLLDFRQEVLKRLKFNTDDEQAGDVSSFLESVDKYDLHFHTSYVLDRMLRDKQLKVHIFGWVREKLVLNYYHNIEKAQREKERLQLLPVSEKNLNIEEVSVL
ncbi:hypothetical protein [Photobacterium kishitanii]|uniref:Uncharacterized protein n=1 Tax=Photobacterium kishitanii TaxID=318456 RepID=A0A2T3KM32_9GAMM|nr:hypothetical protein [Photobacterium kishitanii]PSV00859.1 hypothetical protein C9J27_02200 [Photobacterium kishitanii]